MFQYRRNLDLDERARLPVHKIKPSGVVKLIKSSAEYPEDELPILYDITIIKPPKNINGAHTVKFKVGIYIRSRTTRKSISNTSRRSESMAWTLLIVNRIDAIHGRICQRGEAPEIEIGCHEYDGVEPSFALVNIYFASNTDSFSFVMDGHCEW